MKCTEEMMRLYAVTDRAWTTKQKTLCSQVEDAIKGGVTCVQLREKNMGDDEFFKEAVLICGLCRKYGVLFIVNDNVDIAVRCGADGVHVGQNDMSCLQVRQKIGNDMILGVSVQTVRQAENAQNSGADYLGVGAVFSTSTKDDADSVSFDTLQKICTAVTIPVVAIGGIGEHNIAALRDSGIDGIAAVSAIFASDNITDTCVRLRKLSTELFTKGE